MKESVVLFKFDFAKANDKAFWDFLFWRMENFGMAREFIHMVYILFLEVEVVVNVNGIPLSTFPIWKGIQ